MDPSLDTDMTVAVTAPELDPADIARTALDGVPDGAYEVLADDTSRHVQRGLAGGAAALYPQLP